MVGALENVVLQSTQVQTLELWRIVFPGNVIMFSEREASTSCHVLQMYVFVYFGGKWWNRMKTRRKGLGDLVGDGEAVPTDHAYVCGGELGYSYVPGDIIAGSVNRSEFGNLLRKVSYFQRFLVNS